MPTGTAVGMATLNIWIPCYDDLDQLKGALASLEPLFDGEHDVTVYVVDGRYANFPGETNVTPGARDHCEHRRARRHPVEYHTPPDLPLGEPDVPDKWRSPQHEQAKWVNYELLPQDEWAMEMDTDERLEEADLSVLRNENGQLGTKAKETYQWSPKVLTMDDEQLLPAIRIYKPRYWTFWIDDVLFWREHYPRDTPLEKIVTTHATSSHRNTNYGGVLEEIVLRNLGQERPADYQERRAGQLETMGAEAAAEAVRDGRQPATVDLEEYR